MMVYGTSCKESAEQRRRPPSLRLLTHWAALRGVSRLAHPIPLTSSTRETCLQSVAGGRQGALSEGVDASCSQMPKRLRTPDMLEDQHVDIIELSQHKSSIHKNSYQAKNRLNSGFSVAQVKDRVCFPARLSRVRSHGWGFARQQVGTVTISLFHSCT